MIAHPNQVKPTLALVLCCIAVQMAGCASQNAAESSAKKAITVNEMLMGSLEKASQALDAAQDEKDAIAMAQAAIDRIEVAKRWLTQEEAGRFIENSMAMLDRARLVASGDHETYAALLTMLDEVDIEADVERGSFGSLFGNTGNPLKRKRLISYVVKEKSERAVRLRVSDDVGVIVYVEAPAGRGVRLQLSDQSGVIRCTDSSDHGDLICRFRPDHAGLVTASIINPSVAELTVLVITNHPIEGDLVGASAHPVR